MKKKVTADLRRKQWKQLKISEHKMSSFSARTEVIENNNSLTVISLFKVGENEFLQTLSPIY